MHVLGTRWRYSCEGMNRGPVGAIIFLNIGGREGKGRDS